MVGRARWNLHVQLTSLPIQYRHTSDYRVICIVKYILDYSVIYTVTYALDYVVYTIMCTLEYGTYKYVLH